MHNQLSGSELTKEPFRWDQRMFSLILQIPGAAPDANEKLHQNQVNPEEAPITAMCDVTGGKYIHFCLFSISWEIIYGKKPWKFGRSPCFIILQ